MKPGYFRPYCLTCKQNLVGERYMIYSNTLMEGVWRSDYTCEDCFVKQGRSAKNTDEGLRTFFLRRAGIGSEEEQICRWV